MVRYGVQDGYVPPVSSGQPLSRDKCSAECCLGTIFQLRIGTVVMCL